MPRLQYWQIFMQIKLPPQYAAYQSIICHRRKVVSLSFYFKLLYFYRNSKFTSSAGRQPFWILDCQSQKIALHTLFFLCCGAEHLSEVFGKGEIARIYLNFSDPWPKERHARRRLTSQGFLDIYRDLLAEDGRLEFKTDNNPLAFWAVLQLHPAYNLFRQFRV